MINGNSQNCTDKAPVKKLPQCTRCGKPIRPLPPKLVEKVYSKDSDPKGLSKMCPGCRRRAIWEGCVYSK